MASTIDMADMILYFKKHGSLLESKRWQGLDFDIFLKGYKQLLVALANKTLRINKLQCISALGAAMVKLSPLEKGELADKLHMTFKEIGQRRRDAGSRSGMSPHIRAIVQSLEKGLAKRTATDPATPGSNPKKKAKPQHSTLPAALQEVLLHLWRR